MRFTSGSWELYAETFGDPADPALVLLHGAGNSMMAWDAELCEQLAARGGSSCGSTAATPGKSARADTPGAYSLHDLAADVVALPRRARAAGGGARRRLAGRHDRADRRGRAPRARRRARPDLDHGARATTTCPARSTGLFSGGPEPPDWSDRAAAVRYLVELERPYGGGTFDEELMTRIAERAVDHADDIAAQLSHAVRGPRTGRLVRDRLGEIRAPTVVVHGTADPMFPLEHGRALAAASPARGCVELDGFGHATLPRAVAALVELLAATASAAAAARLRERGERQRAGGGEQRGRAARRRRPRRGARRPPSRAVCPVDHARLISATA